MARKNLLPPRRRRAACDEDRFSDLPDDLLLHILGRLDTRSALGAGALSRRWAHLPRELPVLDLKVTDALPPRYRRGLVLLREARRSILLLESRRRIITMASRYERRAMRAMVASVKGLLSTHRRRRVERLSLEVFSYGSSATCINRLIVDAVDSWGVRDLEVVATPPTAPFGSSPPAYTFPRGRISRKPGESRLQSLKLSNCLPPPLQGFTALARLVLQDLPDTTPTAVYEGVVAACPRLQVLHLLSCCLQRGTSRAVFNAPTSEIRELVIDGHLMVVELRSLPKLESLATLHASVFLRSGAAPRLAKVNLGFSVGRLEGHRLVGLTRMVRNLIVNRLTGFFERAVGMTDLVLRFTGPDMWIAPSKNPFSLMPNLRRLLVADVPSSWDLSWPRLLIEAAPLLESLYVHVPQCDEKKSCQETVPWQPPSTWWRHRHLKELVVIGFQTTTDRQLLRLVRFTMEVSVALRRVALFKHGHVEEKGPCDWEVMSHQSTWSNQEKLDVLDGICSSMPSLEVALG
uniref:Uncharacterized protein n=1 Tax=Avena sativa TaxID=4498 RepID=A0ACD5WS44_AVESA